MEIVRLGEGVDRTGRLSDAALERTFAVLDDYAAAIRAARRRAGPDGRDQRDPGRGQPRRLRRRRGRDRLGVEPEVITGDEEAALSFDGATRELRGTARFAAPYLVVDIGGGSTEFVLGDDDGPQAARSVDIGCVRMTERHLRDDPPTAAADRGRDGGHRGGDRRGWRGRSRSAQARTLVGLAGSVTTVVALALGLDRVRRRPRSTMRESRRRRCRPDHRDAAGATRAERAALPVMHPGRVDVIGGGALVLDTIMTAVRLRRGRRERARHPRRHRVLGDRRLTGRQLAARIRSRMVGLPAVVVEPGTGWPGDLADRRRRSPDSPADVVRLTENVPSLERLDARVSVCRACPRLVAWREEVAQTKRAAFAGERYWGRPITGWGPPRARIAIVGLAPAAHGGNRTGRVFTGDRSGDWLFAALHRAGLARQPTSDRAGDGQRLIDVRMLAAVRCAPPANKPTPEERDACRPWLERELRFLRPTLRVVVALGGFAWNTLWPVLARWATTCRFGGG